MPSAPLQFCAAPSCSQRVPRGYCAQHSRAKEQARPNTEIRKLYYTERWKRLRRHVYQANPFCADCRVALALDDPIDHIIPHMGRTELFWDSDNLAGRCKRCHSVKTRRGE